MSFVTREETYEDRNHKMLRITTVYYSYHPFQVSQNTNKNKLTKW